MKTARHIASVLAGELGISALAGRAHIERLCQAITAELSAPECLLSHDDWNGDRIYRVADHQILPDKRWPLCTVGPDLSVTSWMLAGLAEVEARISITQYFHEPRGELSSRELSAPSFAQYIWGYLNHDRRASVLDSPLYGKPLAISPPRIADFVLGDVLRHPDERKGDDGPFSERYLEIVLAYRYNIDRLTGQPQGFQADE